MKTLLVIEIGTVIGWWTVLREVPNNRPRKFLCRCRCGRVRVVTMRNLRGGLSRSCRGCVTIQEDKPTRDPNRYNQAPEWDSWRQIQNRCYNPKAQDYAAYGGRKITVCDRWRDSYQNFLEDMGKRPGPGYSIDRIDVNGNYEKDNCRWATAKEQANNRRNTRRLTLRGETRCLQDWAVIVGIPSKTLYRRITASGWNDEKALTTPYKPNRRRIKAGSEGKPSRPRVSARSRRKVG